MRNKLALSFFVCVIAFAQQVWPGNVDTTAAYQTVFGRPATQVEIDYWKNRLPATQDELVEINMNWLVSPSGAKDLKETVVRGFQQILHRDPTAAEQEQWQKIIKTSRLKYQDFLEALKPSDLLGVLEPVSAVDVNQGYVTAYGRNATANELDYWKKQKLPATQEEFDKICTDYLLTPNAAGELLTMVVRGFQQVVKRDPNPAEQGEWEVKIKTSRLKYSDFVSALNKKLMTGTVVVTVPAAAPNKNVTRSYMNVFGRFPTETERDYWKKQQIPASQNAFDNINMDYLVSPNAAGELTGVVARGFQQVFQRQPTADELQEWKAKIKASRMMYQVFVAAVKSAAGSDPSIVQYVAVSAPSFETRTESPGFNGSSTEGIQLYAPLNLPDGAIIREFSCGVVPNGMLAYYSFASITYEGWEATHQIGGSIDMDLTTHAPTDYVFQTASIIKEGYAIDNYTYRYYIMVQLVNVGKLQGCRIGYNFAH